VHADGGNGSDFPEAGKMLPEKLYSRLNEIRYVWFTVSPILFKIFPGQVQVFVMVSDFVPHTGNLPDDVRIEAFPDNPEIIGSMDSSFVLYQGKS